jgi:uncharacterized protein (TIGR00369 family)
MVDDNSSRAVTPAMLEAAGWQRSQEDAAFMNHVGPLWRREEEDGPAFAILAEPHHANRMGFVHGGLLMTLADRTLGATARARHPGQRHATIQLDMHFIDGARVGELVEARARVVRRTRAVIFLEGAVTAGPRLVATGKGIWRLFGQDGG